MKRLADDFMERRTRIDIIAAFLEEANSGGSRQTWMIYRGNSNLRQFRQYAKFMISKGLLTERSNSENRVYETTEKGKQFLAEYGRIKASLR